MDSSPFFDYRSANLRRRGAPFAFLLKLNSQPESEASPPLRLVDSGAKMSL
jgi:hypothetical protein